jgi:hypothetical protein
MGLRSRRPRIGRSPVNGVGGSLRVAPVFSKAKVLSGHHETFSTAACFTWAVIPALFLAFNSSCRMSATFCKTVLPGEFLAGCARRPRHNAVPCLCGNRLTWLGLSRLTTDCHRSISDVRNPPTDEGSQGAVDCAWLIWLPYPATVKRTGRGRRGRDQASAEEPETQSQN